MDRIECSAGAPRGWGVMSAGYLLCLVFVLLSVFLATKTFLTEKEIDAQTAGTAKTLMQLAVVRQHIVEAESEAQAFLLTGNAGALTSYRELLPLVERELRELRHLTGDNASQRALIESLDRHAYRRFSILDSLIGLDETSLAREVFGQASQAGSREMQAVKHVIIQLEREQDRPLAQSRALHDVHSQRLQVAYVGCVIAAIVALSVTFVYSRRLLKNAVRAGHEWRTGPHRKDSLHV